MQSVPVSRFSASARIAWQQGAAWFGAAVLAGAMPQAARAQNVGDNFVVPNLPIEYDRGRNTGVLDRERPEYDALGIKLGGFTLRPRIEVAAGYTDNVYQTPVKTGDGYFDFSPGATLTSDWSRNELSLEGGATLRRYLHETRRNTTEWRIKTGGRYDIGGGGAIVASLGTEQATEPATSASYPTAAADASQYRVTRFQLSPTYAMGRVRLQGSYSFSRLRFDPVHDFNGNVISQTNRNNDGHAMTLRGEYAISPDTSVFVQLGFDVLSYMQDIAPGVPNRDSHTYRALVGATLDVTDRIRGALGVGYMSRRYPAAIYPQVSGLTAELRLDYFLDPLTTINLTGRRIVQDAVNLNSGGYINSTVALRVDHELLRNLLLNGQVAYEHDSFQGIAATIDILRFSVGARYLMSRSLGIGLSYQHDSRSPHGVAVTNSYSENRVMISLVGQK